MLFMEGMVDPWPPKWVSKYHAKEELYELRIPCGGVQYRPLFIYSHQNRRCIVVLSGAIEKGNKIPKSVIETALRRAKSYE
jgi:hypothetical protein